VAFVPEPLPKLTAPPTLKNFRLPEPVAPELGAFHANVEAAVRLEPSETGSRALIDTAQAVAAPQPALDLDPTIGPELAKARKAYLAMLAHGWDDLDSRRQIVNPLIGTELGSIMDGTPYKQAAATGDPAALQMARLSADTARWARGVSIEAARAGIDMTAYMAQAVQLPDPIQRVAGLAKLVLEHNPQAPVAPPADSDSIPLQILPREVSRALPVAPATRIESDEPGPPAPSDDDVTYARRFTRYVHDSMRLPTGKIGAIVPKGYEHWAASGPSVEEVMDFPKANMPLYIPVRLDEAGRLMASGLSDSGETELTSARASGLNPEEHTFVPTPNSPIALDWQNGRLRMNGPETQRRLAMPHPYMFPKTDHLASVQLPDFGPAVAGIENNSRHFAGLDSDSRKIVQAQASGLADQGEQILRDLDTALEAAHENAAWAGKASGDPIHSLHEEGDMLEDILLHKMALEEDVAVARLESERLRFLNDPPDPTSFRVVKAISRG